MPHVNRAASLTYFIQDGQQEKAAIVVDQRSSPEESPVPRHTPWHRLGVFTISSGELSVHVDARITRLDLSKSSGNAICADAIRIRRLSP